MRVRRFGFYTRATEVKTPLDIYLQRYSRLSARYTVQRYDQLWYVLGSDELGTVNAQCSYGSLVSRVSMSSEANTISNLHV